MRDVLIKNPTISGFYNEKNLYFFYLEDSFGVPCFSTAPAECSPFHQKTFCWINWEQARSLMSPGLWALWCCPLRCSDSYCRMDNVVIGLSTVKNGLH